TVNEQTITVGEDNIELTADIGRVQSLSSSHEVKKHKLTIKSECADVKVFDKNVQLPYDLELSEGDEISISLSNIKPGYRFVKWSDGNEETTRSYTMAKADATLTANFEEIQKATYNVVIGASKGGTVSVYNEDGKKILGNTTSRKSFELKDVAKGTRLKIEAKPNTNNGYKFVGWSDDKSITSTQRDIIIEENVNVTPIFEEIAYNVTFKATEGGAVSVYNENGKKLLGTAISGKSYVLKEVAKGTKLKIEVKPDTNNGYKFAGWNNGSLVSGNEEEGFTLTTKEENMSLVALFIKDPKGSENNNNTTTEPEKNPKDEQTTNSEQKEQHRVFISANEQCCPLSVSIGSQETVKFNESYKKYDVEKFDREIAEGTTIAINVLQPLVEFLEFDKWTGKSAQFVSGNITDGFTITVNDEDIELIANFKNVNSESGKSVPSTSQTTNSESDKPVPST
ncbi:MAG: InlB B-repeat-containing protein, partial [Malacoplasma sp.]|nr:InlB B-repeat-containing protein [Malacoplasma sp.]